MLVLHPSSTCDVCLEGYNGANVPHAISCGHIFCLRCLQSLTRHSCPLCRTAFQPVDVRKLHIDKSTRSVPSRPPSPAESDEQSSYARTFQRRITRIVREGAKTTEVRTLLEEVREWLAGRSPNEHPDLHAAYLLLFRYTDLQYKASEEKTSLVEIQRLCDHLREQLRSEREAAQAKYADLEMQRKEEEEAALATQKSLRDQYDSLQKQWDERFEIYVDETRKIKAELDELKRRQTTRPPSPSHNADRCRSHFMERDPSAPDYITFSKDDFLESSITGKVAVGRDGIFRLSPIPPSQPIPALSSSANFRPLTDDMDDRDDDEDSNCRKSSMDAYMMRSIDPIPIKHSIYRMPSNSSLLSRPDMDVVPRSVPRGSLDVHMASCSSSPNVSNIHRRDSFKSPIVGSMGNQEAQAMWAERDRPRRTSAGSRSEVRENDDQRGRWLAQLHDLLDSPKPVSINQSGGRSLAAESDGPKHENDDDALSKHGSVTIPRHPSPVSPASSSFVSGTSMAPPPPPASICRASTAAAERERMRAASKLPSPTSTTTSATTVSHTTAVRDRDRDAPMQSPYPQPTPTQSPYPQPTPSQSPYAQPRPTQSRRQSTDGAKGKLATGTASNLTRSLWAMQEAQTNQRTS